MSTSPAASPVRRLQLEDVARVAVPAQPAISPDGGSVVYAVTTVDREADRNRSALWRVRTAGGPPTQLTRGPADSSPAWSPDGSRIAFLRGTGEEPAQVWLVPAGPGEPQPLTSLPGGAGEPVWSPYGTRIAFTAPVAPEPVGPEPAAPIVIDRLGYKRDGVGYWRDRRRHVFVVEAPASGRSASGAHGQAGTPSADPVATGEIRQLTRGDWHAGAPAWSPDGSRLAFAAAAEPDADRTCESAAYVVDLAGGEPRLVGDPHGMVETVAAWTPDGKALLVVGRTDLRAGHQRLLWVPLAGGPTVPLADELDRNVMTGSPGYPGGLPQYTADGRILLFCVRDRGCTHLYASEHRDAAGGAHDVGGGGSIGGPAGDPDTVPRRVLGGADRVVAGLSVARAASKAAVIVATSRSYGEVAVVDLERGGEAILTDHALPDVELLEPVEREFTISDGTRVHGWLLRDPAASTPAPLLVDVHGGPHNAWNPVPNPGRAYRQLLAARGWAVLLLNPRGSDGYGEAFYTAAVGAWGIADEADILEPVDALIAEGVADSQRLAVTGYSYGGYLSCWLTGRTDRFAAAVPGGPVTDLSSMAGTSDLGHLMALQEKGALPYQAPEQLARLSPYSWVGRVETPTLILQGAADDRCPPGQAEQWFTALRGRGVPVQLVLYPEASHLFLYRGRPSHRVDYSRRLIEWVTHYTQRPGHPYTQQRRPRPAEHRAWTSSSTVGGVMTGMDDPAETARRTAERAGVQVRSMTELADLQAIRELLGRIWSGRGDPPVTTDQLRAMTHAGNYAAGAFHEGELVGAAVGFFAAPPGKAMHSHIAGVLADTRARNVGFALKLHQRAWAIERGLTEVTWTFDPLVRRNAYFNLVKLGARPREYLVDFYGEALDDSINRGQGSDRLLLAWDLTSPVVAAGCQGRPVETDANAGGATPVVALSVASSGAPRPAPEDQWRSAGTVLVEVPPDIEGLREQDPATARQWRMAVREVLGELLAGGATVTGFSRSGGYIVEQPG